jgi:hypothetical protein
VTNTMAATAPPERNEGTPARPVISTADRLSNQRVSATITPDHASRGALRAVRQSRKPDIADSNRPAPRRRPSPVVAALQRGTRALKLLCNRRRGAGAASAPRTAGRRSDPGRHASGAPRPPTIWKRQWRRRQSQSPAQGRPAPCHRPRQHGPPGNSSEASVPPEPGAGPVNSGVASRRASSIRRTPQAPLIGHAARARTRPQHRLLARAQRRHGDLRLARRRQVEVAHRSSPAVRLPHRTLRATVCLRSRARRWHGVVAAEAWQRLLGS